MSWGEFQWWLFGLAALLGLIEFLHKRKTRQATRESYGSTAQESASERSPKSPLTKFSNFIFGWRGYGIVALAIALSYALEQRNYVLALAIVIGVLIALSVDLVRLRRIHSMCSETSF